MLRQRRAAGRLGPTVVVHIGNNGPLSSAQLDEMMGLLADVPSVMFVTLRVPREWEAENNAILAAGAHRYPRLALVDWHGASDAHPEFFWDDGVHLRPTGAAAYADLVLPYLQAP